MLTKREARPEMTVREVEMWRSLVMQRSGLFFTDSRLYYLAQRLWERMQRRNVASYSDYYRYVLLDRAGEREWMTLLEGLVNNETRFFRHEPSFAALGEIVRRHGAAGRRLDVWSVGCSSGQEVYSVAMLLLETAVYSPQNAHITGSDISRPKLQQAQNGRYRRFELRGLPPARQQTYLTAVVQGRDTVFEVVPALQHMTSFRYLNLHSPDSYGADKYDIILCQNVLIYFHNEARTAIIERLCHQLRPGGYLFLAPTDVTGLRLPRLQLAQFPDALVYQRVAHGVTEK